MENTTTSRDSPRKISIQMTSDLICPFCIFGLRNLQKGIEIAKSSGCPVDVDLRLIPFILDPSLTDTPVSREAKYQAKYGRAGLESREATIAALGKAVGVDIKYRGPIAQTMLYHRAMWKAYATGGSAMQLSLGERTFLGYFERGMSPGDTDWLSREAFEVGVFDSIQEAKTFFDSDECAGEVNIELAQVRAKGISAVPSFAVDDTYQMSGAQPPEAFAALFKRIYGY